MSSRFYMLQTEYPQIQIAQGRARLLMRDGGSSPYPLNNARKTIESGQYVYVGRNGDASIYKHVADV